MLNSRVFWVVLFSSFAALTARAQNPAPPFTQCPQAGLDTSCRILIVIGANGGQRILTDPNVSPTYDGADDTLIGVLNLSSNPVSSIPLVGVGPIFGFDGDGICSSSITPNPSGCPFGPNQYEGPGVSFSNINGPQDSGLVKFNPPIPANGGTAYFGMELAIPSSCPDADGDGLCDDWEKNGLNVVVNGKSIFIDLPSMGADPNHKDIFVQTDYMVSSDYFCVPIAGCVFGHTHKLQAAALALVTQAFANAPVNNPDGTTGITLHVDCGSDCVMNPKTNVTWGALSKANSLPEQMNLGTAPGGNYNWNGFDALKTPNFLPTGRQQVFHYVVFGHNLGGLDGTSGISRGIGASDLIVSLGSWNNQTGTVLQQAGTFMHELGHNLNLQHGGSDGRNYKPNFLSIMNYLFQTTGLVINGAQGTLDYSRFALPNLNEAALNEPTGLNGGAGLATYGTSFFCQGAGASTVIANANGAIDWNCNGNSAEPAVATDINRDGARTALTSFNDWPNLVYNGGAIGGLGLALSPPQQTPATPELSPTIDAQLTKPLQVLVSSPGITQMFAGTSTTLTFTIANGGTQNDSYTVTANASLPWADLSGVTSPLSLKAGASAQLTIPVTVPANAPVGTVGNFSITAVSTTSPTISDTGTASIAVAAIVITVPPADGKLGAVYGPLQLTAAGGTPPYTWTATGLPGGLTISPAGVISGTPLALGASTATITVTDSTTTVSASQGFAITVAPAATVSIANASLPAGQMGAPYGPVLMNATGGTGPYSWWATNLPPGVSIDPATGTISGAPTGAGQFSVTVTATDMTSASVSQKFAVTVTPGNPGQIAITPASLPAGTQGVAYGPLALTATGGAPPYTWTATGLPPGVSISPAGVISGTASSSGSFSVTVTATDSAMARGSQNYAMTVGAFVALLDQTVTFTAIPDHVATDAPFALMATASSGLPITFSVVSGPATISGNTLTITGTGTIMVRATQAGSDVYAPATATQSFNAALGVPSIITVQNAASLKTGPLAPGSFAAILGNDFSARTALGDGKSTQKLEGVSVTVTDATGKPFTGGLFYVSFRQINFVLPDGVAPGAATITVANGLGSSAAMPVTIAAVAPAIFTANASGSGAPAADVLLTAADGTMTEQFPFSCLPGVGCSTFPIRLSGAANAYLILYGTGIRGLSSISGIRVTLGGQPATVQYAGPQGTFSGLDQVNVLLPASLAGAGSVDLTMTVDGISANTVKLMFQ